MDVEDIKKLQAAGIQNVVHYLHWRFQSKIVGGNEARKGLKHFNVVPISDIFQT
jgi:hypothetical protein